MTKHIQIMLSEQPICVAAGTTLFDLHARYSPNADIMVLNGCPVTDNRGLEEGDAVVFIQRGILPDALELEALMAARHTPGIHARLKQSCVGIAGAGGLGSTVAIALARVGVGRLLIADFDVVEPSNLNRQQYFVEQIGMLKVAALRDTLHRVNPYVAVEVFPVRLDATNTPGIFSCVDVLVEAFDSAEAKVMLVESVMKHRPEMPLVVATGLAGHYPSNAIRTRQAGGTLIVVGDESAAAAPGCGLMAPRVGIAAHHQANAVIRILLGEAAAG